MTVRLLPELLIAWQENLTDFIWSVREHAAIAFAKAAQCEAPTQHDDTVTEETETETVLAVQKQHALVTDAALVYIRSRLLYALRVQQGDQVSDSEIPLKGVLISDPTTTLSKASGKGGAPAKKAPFSFLPQSLLDADAQAKRERLLLEGNAPDNNSALKAGTNTAVHPPIAANTANTTTTDAKTKNKDRKGWGCCIDCVELRTCLPWEVSHGALYLLREMSLIHPDLLYLRSSGRIHGHT